MRVSQVARVVKNPPPNARDLREQFPSWVRKIPWRRAWQPTPAFLPGESHGRRSLEDWVQFSSVAQSCPTLCNPMDCSTPGSLSITSSWSLLKFMSIKSVMPANHFILCRLLLLLTSIFPSIRVLKWVSLCIRWPKYWSFSFSISPSSEHPGLISFRMDWLDLLAVQGTLKESSPTPQLKSVNYSVLSFLYSQTLTSIHDYGKTIALTNWTFVSKGISDF